MRVLKIGLLCFAMWHISCMQANPMTAVARIGYLVASLVKVKIAIDAHEQSSSSEATLKCAGCNRFHGMGGVIGMLSAHALKKINEENNEFDIAKQFLDASVPLLSHGTGEQIHTFLISCVQTLTYECPQCNRYNWQPVMRVKNSHA